ncbi:MAG: urate hydroxylase PuuD [Beijerinckiaceae bacterium]
MAKILEKMYYAIAAGAVLTLIALIVFDHKELSTSVYWAGFFTFLHVLSGITWIGLLYYFNLVQIPTMPKIPAELKPAVGKFIAPEALFWFRWSALSTVVTGLIVFSLYTKDGAKATIYTGMVLGLIMAANVWFIIWPNQQKALGLVPAADAAKAKAARLAMLASRTNFVLSLPMLYCMVFHRFFPV